MAFIVVHLLNTNPALINVHSTSIRTNNMISCTALFIESHWSWQTYRQSKHNQII